MQRQDFPFLTPSHHRESFTGLQSRLRLIKPRDIERHMEMVKCRRRGKVGEGSPCIGVKSQGRWLAMLRLGYRSATKGLHRHG